MLISSNWRTGKLDQVFRVSDQRRARLAAPVVGPGDACALLCELILGSITTAFGALSRLIDDYDSLARKEMVTAAREKANT